MRYFSIIFAVFIFSACNWVKQKAKDTVNKGGEVVAKTGSEFVDGVTKGVEKTFRNEAELSEDLKKKGLSTGKILIGKTDSATDNVLSVYFIFGDSITQNVNAKVYDEDGQEYGRTSIFVTGKKNEAKYIDFIFEKRTNIDSKGKVRFD